MKKSYIEARGERKRETGNDDVILESLPPKKHDHPLLLGAKVKAYVKASRAKGCVINTSLVIAGWIAIVKKTNPDLLKNNLHCDKDFLARVGKELYIRMGYVRCRGTTREL